MKGYVLAFSLTLEIRITFYLTEIEHESVRKYK